LYNESVAEVIVAPSGTGPPSEMKILKRTSATGEPAPIFKPTSAPLFPEPELNHESLVPV
jgi:hypothetical protein